MADESGAEQSWRFIARMPLREFQGAFDDPYVVNGLSASAPLVNLLRIIHGRWTENDREILTGRLGMPENYLPVLGPPELADMPSAVLESVPPRDSYQRIYWWNRDTDERAALSPQEAEIVRHLLSVSAEFRTPAQIGVAISVKENSARAALLRIRCALGKAGADPMILENQYASGYRLAWERVRPYLIFK